MKLSLQWRSFLALAALLVALLAAVNLALSVSLPAYLRPRIETDLAHATILARAALADVPLDQLDAAAHRLHTETGLRVTVIAADGKVIAESNKQPAELAAIENHLYRPEVQAAIRADVGHARRRSDTVHVDLAYCAVRAPHGFIRLALPLHEITATTRHVQRTVFGASAIVGLAALPLVYLLARRISQPLAEMRQMAVRVAHGDLTNRVPTNLDGELADLAVSLNSMAAQLDQRLQELAAEKAELNATLANMTEGVLVVDTAGTIRLANRALQRQLNVSAIITGHSVLAAFRNTALQDLVHQALTADQVTGRELTFLGNEERAFEVNATRLRTPTGESTGAVIVLHDITRIKALESMRKDFVANVSHELRTPLSIIKGYVETLLDDPRPDQATADSFLHTIQRHSSRLEILIADLLTISALESQQAKVAPVKVALRPAAEAARDELQPQAAAKNTRIQVDIPTSLPEVLCDPDRLHQVFVNLLDNAIKYSPPGSQVTVTATASGPDLQVCVADNGPGIPPEHLDRIFERFYRVDKARSRAAGGTGLGLSIVKHIIQAHHGRVWAESELERGSRFYFTLPLA